VLFGLDGIIYSPPIADACSIFMALALFMRINNQIKKEVQDASKPAPAVCPPSGEIPAPNDTEQ
jgi:hypothetical protein